MKKLQQESIYSESSTLYANWLGEELKFSAICTVFADLVPEWKDQPLVR